MDMDKVRRIGVSVRPFVHVRIGNFAGHRKIRGFGDLEALSYERPPAASRVSVKGIMLFCLKNACTRLLRDPMPIQRPCTGSCSPFHRQRRRFGIVGCGNDRGGFGPPGSASPLSVAFGVDFGDAQFTGIIYSGSQPRIGLTPFSRQRRGFVVVAGRNNRDRFVTLDRLPLSIPDSRNRQMTSPKSKRKSPADRYKSSRDERLRRHQ